MPFRRRKILLLQKTMHYIGCVCWATYLLNHNNDRQMICQICSWSWEPAYQLGCISSPLMLVNTRWGTWFEASLHQFVPQYWTAWQMLNDWLFTKCRHSCLPHQEKGSGSSFCSLQGQLSKLSHLSRWSLNKPELTSGHSRASCNVQTAWYGSLVRPLVFPQ